MSYNFFFGGKTIDMAFFLGYELHPEWSIFICPIHEAHTDGLTAYTRMKYGDREDIESLFCVMKSNFKKLRREGNLLNVDDVVLISVVCFILHNILINMGQCCESDEEIEEKKSSFTLSVSLFSKI